MVALRFMNPAGKVGICLTARGQLQALVRQQRYWHLIEVAVTVVSANGPTLPSENQYVAVPPSESPSEWRRRDTPPIPFDQSTTSESVRTRRHVPGKLPNRSPNTDH